jgi:histidinol dehydrogenase
MPQLLKTSDADFEDRFATFLGQKREVSDDVDTAVREIISEVRARGDAAVIAYTEHFDRLTLTPETLRVSSEEIASALAACDAETLDALEFARARIKKHHLRQRPSDDTYTDETGATLGSRWTAVEAAGTVRAGRVGILSEFGADERRPGEGRGRAARRHGGPDRRAWSIRWSWRQHMSRRRRRSLPDRRRAGDRGARLRNGDDQAGRQDRRAGQCLSSQRRSGRCSERVGIDSIAGPSEVLVIADANNDPDWIAADLLAQAEHDTAAQSILMTDDASFADAVSAPSTRQLAKTSRAVEHRRRKLERLRRDYRPRVTRARRRHWRTGSPPNISRSRR